MADDKNGKRAKEDMTPVPTQAELDTLKDGKDAKDRKVERKAPETLPPTPTQAEADDTKAKLFGTTVEKREAREAPEVLPPTPTQLENDKAKTDAMYMPEGSTDPQKADPQQRRTVEASKPGGYQTRAAEAAPARATE
jgi:hypothetical protein